MKNQKEESLIFREVISNALPMVFFTHPFKHPKDIEKAPIRFINKNLLKMIGLTDREIEEMVGKNFKNMMDKLISHKDSVAKYFENLIGFHKVEGTELLLDNRNGENLAVHANSRCIKIDGGWYAQGIFADKTPEKKLEKKIRTSQSKIKALQTELEKIHREDVVFSSPEMQRVVKLAAKVADLSTTVLIQGETGTGKELIARAIHRNGSRAAKPFFIVNCGALPETLLESELFGHVKGSFTGAIFDRCGYFEAADGGTIFLDEIGELSPATQVKLLRVLEDQTIRPLGSNLSTKIDVRIIAATHRNLSEEMHRNKFRDDLYYRLAILPINIPPLRERLEDILPLTNHFIRHFSEKLGNPVKGISPQAVDKFLAYSWPGNARELQNVIERALILCKEDHIQPSHLLFDLSQSKAKSNNIPDGNSTGQFHLKNVEYEEIQRALRECDGNRSKASEKLGIARSTLWRKLRQQKALE
ncbi:MAG: sigma-54 dependent transcriptional regulator [Nitrospinota bacterium]